MKLALAEGKELIGIAKQAVECSISRREIEINSKLKEKYSFKRGVFVTLTIDGELRGCIGYPSPILPLWKAVNESAINAAQHDPRFPPVSEDEMNEITFEVSVLTVPEEIKIKKPEEYPEHVNIGEDGLIIESDAGSGLLLPQVFPEWRADSKKALSMTCEKAGLPSGCWQEEGVRVFKFQAQVFYEDNGEIKEKRG